MNGDRLLDAFDRLGDEPDAVQQFRKIVVGLAISGKLIVIDKAAFSASDLLKQIEGKKLSLVRQGLLRKQKPSSNISLEDLPKGFVNPLSFVRLGEIAKIEKGQTGIMKASPGAYPLVVTAAERGTCDHFDFDGAAAIVPLVSSAGHGVASIQRLHYQEGKFALGSILAAVFPHAPELISARFLFEYLTSFKDELLVSRMIGTANVSLSVAKVSDVPVPLVPPLVQRKVDGLMGLCDRLEEARAGRERSRDRLAEASLARLNAPDPETFQNDARFALNALPALTMRPDQIKRLRQTIINLAVRGKLISQDPKDEPASELLKRIAKMRIVRVGKGELQKAKSIAPPSLDATLFQVPVNWEWAVADQLWDFENGDRSSNYPSRDQLVAQGIPFVNAGHLIGGRVSLAEMNYITRAKFTSLGGGKLRRNDQLYCLRGSLGKHAVFDLDCDAAIASSLVILRPVLADCVPYLSLYLDSNIAQTFLRRFDNGSAQPNLSSASLRKYEIPLPPLAEQHRIVAKVNALMTLCDRLEASLTATATTRRRLLDALLAEALTPVSAREMETAE